VDNPNWLLRRIEEARLWAYFHKDWLLQIRSLLRGQLPPEYHLFVESEAILISRTVGEVLHPLLPVQSFGRHYYFGRAQECWQIVMDSGASI
jgi:hypothetical protein